MKKDRWLSRDISAPGPYLTLCLSEEEYFEAMKWIGQKHPPPWRRSATSDAVTTLTFNVFDNVPVAIVSLINVENKDGISIAGLLVHEATHIWQEWCRNIGEDNPGDEQEAYAIDSIFETLAREYVRRLNKCCTQ